MGEDMKTGAYVSGAGHAALFLWLLIGGFFVARDDFDAVTVTDVSIISEDQFLAAQPSSPETGEAPPGLDAPPEDAPAPEVAQPDTPIAPEAPAPAPLTSETNDAPPAPVEAPPAPPAPEAPDQPEGDPGAVILAEDAPELAPEQAEVIADQVTEAPEPEVQVEDAAQLEAAPDAAAEAVQEAPQDQTATEQTTTQVVTEADETSNRAPTISNRPGRKPTPPPQPVQVAEPDAPTEESPATPGLQDLIEDAVEEANSEPAPASQSAPSAGGGTGTPLTRQEKSGLILGIKRCWNVGALSTDALKITVVVGFSMTPDAKPEVGSIRMISAQGGSGVAVDRAFEAARRAIIRCGSGGLGLPVEKYDTWRNIEASFNASTQEIR